ncbi:MAG: hypothetical protein JO287_16820 [Pseudonocardiales bacterium]|nr:hypothetical protein [Pseudonocardiales bacterium]
MSERALQVIEAGNASPRCDEAGWLEWLRGRLDPDWRPGEWDSQTLLFTGDLHSARTAAWSCRTPGCCSAARYHHRRCSGCRRARSGLGSAGQSSTPRRRRGPVAR